MTEQATDKREKYYAERMRHAQPYDDFDAPSVEVALNLIYSYDVFQARFSPMLASHGLSISAFNVLMVLRQYGNPGCPLHELGELLLVSRANVTGLMDGLEANGLVVRALDPADRRVRLAVITDEGNALIERLLPCHHTFIRRALAGLSGSEKSTLSQLLRKVRGSVQQMKP